MPLAEDFSMLETESPDFSPVPPGQYHVEVEDICTREGKNLTTGEPETKMYFIFRVIDDTQWYGRKLWSKDFTRKLNPKTKLYESGIIPAFLGRPLTEDDMKNAVTLFNTQFWNSLIGKHLLIMVTQKPKKSDPSVMTNMIVSYFPTDKELPPFDKAKVNKAA